KDAMEFFKNGDNSYLKKILRPGKELTDFLPKIIVKETAIEAIVNGAPLYSAGVEKVEGNLSLNSIVAIFSPQEELISLGKVVNNLDISSKDPFVKMETVIMERGKYPKTWKL
ncbi:MAG: PUA domain-containing protein, partial [Thermoplasmata archaeon]